MEINKRSITFVCRAVDTGLDGILHGVVKMNARDMLKRYSLDGLSTLFSLDPRQQLLTWYDASFFFYNNVCTDPRFLDRTLKNCKEGEGYSQSPNKHYYKTPFKDAALTRYQQELFQQFLPEAKKQFPQQVKHLEKLSFSDSISVQKYALHHLTSYPQAFADACVSQLGFYRNQNNPAHSPFTSAVSPLTFSFSFQLVSDHESPSWAENYLGRSPSINTYTLNPSSSSPPLLSSSSL